MGKVKKARDKLFETMLTDSRCHDVHFVVKGQTFGAPLNLLVTQSDVFDTMFSGVWKESKEKWVKIDDIEPEVFAEVLRFLITGSVSDNSVLNIGLLMAADMVRLFSIVIFKFAILS